MHFFDLYQQLMKKSASSVTPFNPAQTWPKEWKTVQTKVYERFPLYKLPPAPPLGTPLSQAFFDRRSGRTFGHSLKETQLSQLLWYSLGEQASDAGTSRRLYPSAGGLYPLEGYLLLTQSVGTIAPGLYHYDVPAHGLRTLLTKLPPVETLIAATAESYVGGATGALILTACLDRTAPKYAERAYKFALLEAGAVMQNFALVAAAVPLDAVVVGTFAEDILEPLLAIDGTHEVALQSIWFG